jgi:hypothetical protein
MDGSKAGELAAKFKAAATLIADAGAEGWLLHMAFAAAKPEAFSDVHSTILEIVQVKRSSRVASAVFALRSVAGAGALGRFASTFYGAG